MTTDVWGEEIYENPVKRAVITYADGRVCHYTGQELLANVPEGADYVLLTDEEEFPAPVRPPWPPV